MRVESDERMVLTEYQPFCDLKTQNAPRVRAIRREVVEVVLPLPLPDYAFFDDFRTHNKNESFKKIVGHYVVVVEEQLLLLSAV